MLYPQLEWEINGPNRWTTMAEVEISVDVNDITGKYHVFVGKKEVAHGLSLKTAVERATREAHKIYRRVQ